MGPKFPPEEVFAMENILISLNTVLPLFLTIGVGCIAKHYRLISDGAIREANGLCFKVFMSALLFNSVYTSDLGSAFDGRVLALCLLGISAEFLAGMVLVPRIEQAPPAQGVMVQAFFRSNTVLMGMPIAISLFGSDNVGQISMVLAIVVPFLNILSVVALELFRGGKPSLRHIVKGVATNPLVLGAVTGMIAVALGIQLPKALNSVVTSLANAATPLALVLMGASLDFSKLKRALRNMAVCTVARLAAAPAVFLTIGVLMGFRGVSLCTALVVFATPVAVNSYNMAMQMDGDADLAGGIVLMTTLISCLTLFLWIWLLKALGLL